jgi:hypothetical protein
VAESTLPYLSELARRDKDFVVRLATGAGLDEGDIAYLLGTEPDSKEVSEIVAKVRAVKGSWPSDRAGRTGSKPGGRGKRSLTDF